MNKVDLPEEVIDGNATNSNNKPENMFIVKWYRKSFTYSHA